MTKIKSRTSHYLTDDQGREFELEWRADDYIDPVVEDNDDGSVTVRYACRDDMPGDYEWGEGVEFIEFWRGDNRDQWITENLETCKHCGYLFDEHSEVVYNAFGEDTTTPFPIYDPIEPHDFEPAFTWDDTHHFWVEKYEHGLVSYGLTSWFPNYRGREIPGGESSQVDRRWDVSVGCAILILDNDWNPDNTENIARNMLERYTSWCNGGTYCAAEQHYTLVDGEWVDDGNSEIVGGYIGDDEINEVLKEGL